MNIYLTSSCQLALVPLTTLVGQATGYQHLEFEFMQRFVEIQEDPSSHLGILPVACIPGELLTVGKMPPGDNGSHPTMVFEPAVW
ncbi:hypothetical protein AV530_005894 [Patagioenas fasciata monilis]|uniref:Uncharacterized protein n=1 Tax=Patagioenas fasciata monilis TaxID=372326 RepID=A0A1V4JN01_PATFA|nr:hypothetical protein AV530_005894 [Patagioenas fasciata monilis]